MKICLNFYGQPKNIYNLKEMYDKYIYNSDYEIYIVYTTWKTENIDTFKNIFPNAYINLIDTPSTENDVYMDIINNYNLDITNLCGKKSINGYFLGLYSRDYSRNTIINFEITNNIKFDIILTTRPDIKLKNNISIYFDEINNDTNNTIFVGSDPCFNIYNECSYPDVLCMSKRDTMMNLLDFINILKHCTLNNKKIFHPETSAFKLIKYKNLNIKYLNFYVFVHQ